MVGVSHINHIKMDNIKYDLGMPSKITDNFKKKRLNVFAPVVLIHSGTSNIKLSYKNDFLLTKEPEDNHKCDRMTL